MIHLMEVGIRGSSFLFSDQENRRFYEFLPTFGRHEISGIWIGLREDPVVGYCSFSFSVSRLKA